MKINGSDFYFGAFTERHQENYLRNRPKISEDMKSLAAEQIKSAWKELKIDEIWGNAVRVEISQEAREFLCSEEGYEKMLKDEEEFYLLNQKRQKEIAAGRDTNDPFWSNTGNQFLVFSEYLYNNEFYESMDDESMQEMEDMLAKITAGMDHISRNQYMTGIEFSSFYGKGSNFFMTSAEAAMELESSTNALRYFCDKFVPEDKKGEFQSLIDSYNTHNAEVLGEYISPLENVNRAISNLHLGIKGGKYPNSSLLKSNMNEKRHDNYAYELYMGGIQKTKEEEQNFRNNLSLLFSQFQSNNQNDDGVWSEIEALYIDYATDGSENQGLENYVKNNSVSTIKRMKSYWSDLLKS